MLSALAESIKLAIGSENIAKGNDSHISIFVFVSLIWTLMVGWVDDSDIKIFPAKTLILKNVLNSKLDETQDYFSPC